MNETQTPQTPPAERSLVSKLLYPAVLALIFQYAYLAFYVGLRAGVALTFLDGLVLMWMFLNKGGPPDLTTWIIKSLIQWPILGILGSLGALNWFARPDRTRREQITDAILVGGMIAVLVADLLIVLHQVVKETV